MNRIGAIVICAALLSGCAGEAVVSDVSDSSVKVQANSFTKMEDIHAKADETCAIYGKSAIPLSKQCLNGYCTMANYLFACKATGSSPGLVSTTTPSQPASPPPPPSQPVTVGAGPAVYRACTLADGSTVARTAEQCKADGGTVH